MNVYETFVNVIKLISKMMCEAFNYDSNDSNGIDNNGIPFNQLCTLKIFFFEDSVNDCASTTVYL